MEAELGSLRRQLDAEKARYQRMQRDLQKELSAAFEENAKLSALLEGKVPKRKAAAAELGRQR